MKHIYSLALVLIIILIQIDCYAQTSKFQIKILDISSLEPVPFSTLSWGDHTGTISDDQGFARLSINIESSDTIFVSCIGFSAAKVAVNELSVNSINNIYLSRELFELDDVTITARKKKIQNSKKIIREAIASIEDNYSLDSYISHGYYREYTKDSSSYINVFESIIDLQDPGFEKDDNFKSRLLFKRSNSSFKTDSLLMIPYDNLNKLVPFSRMGVQQNNELLILRTHDPIRNYQRYSFDFICLFQQDFLPNHDFAKPKITYLDEEPYYFITFKDKIGFDYQKEIRFMAEGFVYINVADFGIKKLSYKVNLDNYVQSCKLFEVNVDYKKQADKYYLNYISFNNLFSFKEVHVVNQSIDTVSNSINLFFNRELISNEANNFENYQAFQDEEELEFSTIQVEGDKVSLWVSNKKLTDEKQLSVNVLWLDDEDAYKNAGVFKSEPGRKTYYQYREFFVKETRFNDRLDKNIMDKSRSVFQNKVVQENSTADTSWLNTPLIEEEVESTMLTAENKKILESLQPLYKLNGVNDNELMYMHADREVYAPGDTVWLKAYVQSKPDLTSSDKSSLLYLQLVDEKGNIVESSKFLIFDASAKAQLKLDAKLEDGYYYLVAYSSWMKNFTPESVCKKKILVKNDRQLNHQFIPALNKTSFLPGDTVKLAVRCFNNYNREFNNVPFNYSIRSGNKAMIEGDGLASNSDKTIIKFVIPTDQKEELKCKISGEYKGKNIKAAQSIKIINEVFVDFFPEGGHCVNYQPIDVAFKAISNTGEPIRIKGNIVDDTGEKIVDVVSLHDGMGKFLFTPEKGKNFYLELTEPSSLSGRFQLPTGEKEGWNLSAKYNNANLQVDVNKTDRHEKSALITLKVRDHLYFHKVIEVKHETQVQIPTDGFPMGVGVLTLFDDEMKPRAERLVFINQEQANNVVLQTGAVNYTPRDSVHLKLKVATPNGEPVSGSYSLSVFDDDLGASPEIDENNIVSSLIFSTEIKGNIHNPNYYANLHNAEVMRNLDLLLLCQGWRNYNYLNELYEVDSISKPSDQDIISGQVLEEVTGKPIQSKVSVFFGMQSTDLFTDKKGKFSFKIEYNPVNSPNISMYSKALNGRTEVELVLDSSKFEQQLKKIIPTLIDGQKFADESQLVFNKFEEDFSFELENHIWIEEISITTKRAKDDELFYPSDVSVFGRIATKENLDNTMEIYDVLLNMGLNIEKGVAECDDIDYEVIKTYVRGKLVEIHWYVNDFLQTTCMGENTKAFDYSSVSNIQPELIDRLTFIKGEEARMIYGNNFDAVVDIHFSPKLYKQASGLNKVNIKNVSEYKEFYTPRYETPGKDNTIPDLRKTIHWEPNIELDENGEATVVFYNADRYSTIKCVLEGVSAEGVPSCQQMNYKVTVYK